MENKLKIMATGLGLAGLVNLSCIQFEEEKTLFECEAGDVKVKIVKEIYNNDYDRTRLDLYNKNHEPVLTIDNFEGVDVFIAMMGLEGYIKEV